jgi:hypothetical protein
MRRCLAKLVAAAAVLALWASPTASWGQLPFSDIPPSRPTVSPYLNLLQRQGQGLPNYQTLVKPALQTRQEMLQQQTQIQQLQRQTRQLTQRSEAASRGISREIRGTGHVTTFMEFSHFYPGLRR